MAGALALASLATGCGGDDGATEELWDPVTRDEPGALLSVWGTSADDVWVVGADARDGTGPTVLHVVDGEVTRVTTGESEGYLWWVFGFADGPTYMAGSNGLILRYEAGEFTKMSTPGTGTVFGLWGASPTDMWAVGGTSESGGGFAWRLQGEEWVAEEALPADVVDTGALWKVHGVSSDQVWLVGSNGLSFYWNGTTLEPGDTGVGSSLFTVFGNDDRFAAVGGLASGIIVENDGSGWVDATPDPLPSGLTGVSLDLDGGGIAVGNYGTVLERVESRWQPVDLGFLLDENLHAVWIDPDGGVWAAGGYTFAPPATAGVLIHRR